jgi:beta-hydroxylase
MSHPPGRDVVNFHCPGFNPGGSEFIMLHGGTAIIAADYAASSGYPRNLGQKGWALGGAVSLLPTAPATKAKSRLMRPLRRSAKAVAVAVPLIYFFPKLSLFYALCGIYDATRNKPINRELLDKYFLGNGVFTWIMAPFNIFLDILCVPYGNKGVYKLEDLPKPYQQELQRVLDTAISSDLVGLLQEKVGDEPRAMFFFKWYGKNVETDLRIPAFHDDYKYVKTIGVSVFSKRESTSRHFGYTRASLRVLYNINDIDNRRAHIVVGPVDHYWCEKKLFIFDDTLLHQSFNESDEWRYCMFIDIVRPSSVPTVMYFFIQCIRSVSGRFNSIFYQRWKIIRP